MVRASIIIPAFNEEKNLARLLPLIAGQLDAADEVIVVNNASSDSTAEVARALNAKVIDEPRKSRARARNAGYKHARGDSVVFIDADCLPENEWLQNLLAPFNDESVGCVGGEILTAEIVSPFGKYLAEKGHLSQTVTFAHPFLPFAQTGNVAFRRAVLEQIGSFDDRLEEGEDADLCWRMQLETNYRLVYSPRSIVLHWAYPSLRNIIAQKRRHACGAVLLYKKYRTFRHNEQPKLKMLYWEYRSMIRRGAHYMVNTALGKLGWGSKPNPEQGYQLLVEIGEKLGRLEGSFRHRVWYL